MPELRQTTQIVVDSMIYHEGKPAYSQGMKENYEIEDLEIKDVPGMFVNVVELQSMRLTPIDSLVESP